MDWDAITFDWNQARAFLATAEEGSLSAAARVLGQTQPTIGRQIAALEQALGVALFERAGRSQLLTPAGRDLLEHVAAMRDAAGRVALLASGQSQALEGMVRITASEVMSALVLPPFFRSLRDTAPMIQVDLVAADGLSDLLRREADIAVRHVRPEQPSLIARKVCEATARLYAASDYLDRRGRPARMADLATHDFVGLSDVGRMLDYLVPLGLPVTEANFRAGSANGVAAWALVQNGLGISVMSDDVARRTQGIEAVLPDMTPIRFPVWLTSHRDLVSNRRIRLVFDRLADFLASRLG